MTDEIARRLATVREQISAAASSSGRDPRDVTLVAVAKTFPAEAVSLAARAGATDFGENRVQELVAKAGLIDDQVAWHFVGHLQTNKARDVVGLVKLVHSVDRLSLAQELAKRARAAGIEQQVLVEVNIGGEDSKNGVDVAGAKTLAQRAASLEGIHVAGLMAIPPKPETPDASRPFFSRLRDLRDEIATVAPSVADLSMGMSADLGVAVEEGATIVRVGEAIFGPR